MYTNPQQRTINPLTPSTNTMTSRLQSRFISCLFVLLLCTIPLYAALSEHKESAISQPHSLSVSVPAIDPSGYTVDIAVEPPYTSTAPRRIGAGDNASFGDGEDGTKLPEVNNDGYATPIGDLPIPLLFLFIAAYLAIKRLHSCSYSARYKNEHPTITNKKNR